MSIDLAKCSLGEFIGAERDKIELRRDDSGDWEYVLRTEVDFLL